MFLYRIIITLAFLFQFYILKLNRVKRDNHNSLLNFLLKGGFYIFLVVFRLLLVYQLRYILSRYLFRLFLAFFILCLNLFVISILYIAFYSPSNAFFNSSTLLKVFSSMSFSISSKFILL